MPAPVALRDALAVLLPQHAAQVDAFLLGLAALRDWRLPLLLSMNVANFVMSRAADEQSSPQAATTASAIRPLILQLLKRDSVHCVPEPPGA